MPSNSQNTFTTDSVTHDVVYLVAGLLFVGFWVEQLAKIPQWGSSSVTDRALVAAGSCFVIAGAMGLVRRLRARR